MSMPFYVSPEQLMKDRADYARKGIARGRSVIVSTFDDGIVFVTENPSRALHKISEIYDRIGFAAVGKYNAFEALRVAGIRYADLRGFSYDRTDVIARGLANAYAQTLGTAFTTESKPQEVELVVAQAGTASAQDQMYRISFDGSVAEEHDFIVMGGQAEVLHALLGKTWRGDMTLPEILTMIHRVLSITAINAEGAVTVTNLPVTSLEVAVLDRTKPRRLFRRLLPAQLEPLITLETTETAQ